MSAQILNLFGTPPPVAGELVAANEPIAEIIEELEDLLVRAKAGQIRAMIAGVVMLDDDNDLAAQRIMLLPEPEHLYLLLGAARYAMLRVEDECFG